MRDQRGDIGAVGNEKARLVRAGPLGPSGVESSSTSRTTRTGRSGSPPPPRHHCRRAREACLGVAQCCPLNAKRRLWASD